MASLTSLQRAANGCCCSARSPVTAAPALARRCRRAPPAVRVFAAGGGAGGFDKKSNKKKVSTQGGMVVPKEGKNVKSVSQLLDDDAPSTSGKGAADGAPQGFPNGWVDLGFKARDMPLGRNTKPIMLKTGRALMLYKFDGRVFVSDANSTAYQYPMTDARVFRDPATGCVAAEVPLDGSVYDLATGAVLTWCPKDGNPMRSLLGTLKGKVEPTPLKVFPVHVTKDGDVWTKLV